MQPETTEEKKLFISPLEMRDMSHELASRVWRSGYRPTHLVALWRGGAQVALYVDEYLALLGCPVDNVAVRTSLYTNQQAQRSVKVHGEQYLVDVLQCEHRVLFVDDILESGRSVAALYAVLRQKLGPERTPEFRLATLLTKSQKWIDGNPKSDYALKDVAADCWVQFPHELDGLDNLASLLQQMSTESAYRLTQELGLANREDLDTDSIKDLPPLHRHLYVNHCVKKLSESEPLRT